jgi:hypothetical protein
LARVDGCIVLGGGTAIRSVSELGDRRVVAGGGGGALVKSCVEVA